MRTLVPYRSGRASVIEGLDNILDSFFAEPMRRNRAPAVDIRAEDDIYMVKAELPGVAEEDLTVSIDDNVLTISANAGKDAEHKGEGYLVRERRQAAYTRSFVLPIDADHKGMNAIFKDGLLTLNVPKNKASKARKIPINAS